MRKHQPSPTAAITSPAIAGPMRRAPFAIDELMAMALLRSAILDHLDEEGLAPRHVERVDQTLESGERDDLARA